jgi:hypothetical protein
MFMKNRQRRGMVQESISRRHPPHLLDEYSEHVALSLVNQFKNDDFGSRLQAIVRHCHDVDPMVRRFLAKALLLSAKRAIDFANQLAAYNAPKHPVTTEAPLNGQGSQHSNHRTKPQAKKALLWRMDSGQSAGHDVDPQRRHSQQRRR